MTTAGIWRALTPTEKVYADKEIYVGYTVRASGSLDLDALRTAYAAVCRAHPQLASRLGTDEHGLVVVASDTPPEVQVHDGDPAHALAGVRLGQDRALSGLNVVRDGDRASVTLVNHHCVADADHSLAVFSRLWSCYTDTVEGVPFDLPRHPYPRPLEALLGERGFQVNTPVAKTPGATVEPSPDLRVLVRHVAQLRLTEAQTTALAEFGRRHEVTLNGLLSAAILLVEAQSRDIPLTDLVLRFTVNLRNRVTPHITPTEGTNVVGGGRFMVPAGTTPTPVAIARVVADQLRTGLADGSIQRSLLDMVDLVNRQTPGEVPQETPHPRHVVVSLTNWGRIPPMRTPAALALTNFQSASHIRESPAHFDAARGYVASTFGGRLGIDLAFPEKTAEQAQRIDDLRELLVGLTQQG
ncbi:phthiocerol/phthiodiolone dimycocerosyl transferase family protein [Actinokineospora pegani]|uniref:phthiocerol/phthiodiolone dimycocerosyl transferase family protein n=1 Tax=Actinokineospora pegani TaxID=2654637 RepID=UPI0012EA463F|nr:acyltransferase [Actinokineospora pegani]